MNRKKILLMGIGLFLIVLFSSSFLLNPPNLQTSSYSDDTPLISSVTGDQSLFIDDLVNWTMQQITNGSVDEGIWLDILPAKNSTFLTPNSSAHNGKTVWNNYLYTVVSDSVDWRIWHDADFYRITFWIGYPNPDPNRQYALSEYNIRMKWCYHTGWCGWNDPRWQFTDGVTGWTTYIIPSACNAWVWMGAGVNYPTDYQNSDMGAYLGGLLYQKIYRDQGWGLDDTSLFWDFASTELQWIEFHKTGNATSPNYQIGDVNHSFKQLNNITYRANIPTDSSVVLQYNALLPTGWSGWLTTTNGTSINALASDLQVRFQLNSDSAYHQKTPNIKNLTLNYGDPPANSPPIISNIQQNPSAGNVGYKDAVNVSCQVETIAPLNQVVINYTNTDWSTFSLVNMTDSLEGFGKSNFSGLIPAMNLGLTVKYKIFAENQWENETQNFTSGEYSYTIIDNVPPNIIHQNSTMWVNPLHPSASNSKIKIECQATDEKVSITSVDLYVTQPTIYTNTSFSMNWNASGSRYWYEFDQLISNGTIEYYIEATDSNANVNQTKIYTITIDTNPPEVTSFTDPTMVEYSNLVYVLANITDPNGINTVKFKWSDDNWANNHSLLMPVFSGDTYRTNALIPNRPYNTIIVYEIFTNDSIGNNCTYYDSYTVDDFTAPNIQNIGNFPTQVTETSRVIINCTVDEPTDASGIETVIMFYTTSQDNHTAVWGIIMTQVGSTNQYIAIIDELPLGTNVTYQIYARDTATNEVYSPSQNYQVIEVIVLFNTMAFIAWILVIIFIFAGLYIFHYLKKLNAYSGALVVGGGSAIILTFGLLGYLPFELRGLTIGEFFQEFGTNNWILLIVGVVIAIVVGFFVLTRLLRGKEEHLSQSHRDSGFRIPISP